MSYSHGLQLLIKLVKKLAVSRPSRFFLSIVCCRERNRERKGESERDRLLESYKRRREERRNSRAFHSSEEETDRQTDRESDESVIIFLEMYVGADSCV